MPVISIFLWCAILIQMIWHIYAMNSKVEIWYTKPFNIFLVFTISSIVMPLLDNLMQYAYPIGGDENKGYCLNPLIGVFAIYWILIPLINLIELVFFLIIRRVIKLC